MSDDDPLIRQSPTTSASMAAWRRGDLEYDLSELRKRAAAGDLDAQAMLRAHQRAALVHRGKDKAAGT